MLQLTERAADALRMSSDAARRFDPDARIALRRGGEALVVELTHAPAPGEAEVSIDGVTLIVADGLSGTVDTTDHNAFTLAP